MKKTTQVLALVLIAAVVVVTLSLAIIRKPQEQRKVLPDKSVLTLKHVSKGKRAGFWYGRPDLLGQLALRLPKFHWSYYPLEYAPRTEHFGVEQQDHLFVVLEHLGEI
jgi:hypothetical protein